MKTFSDSWHRVAGLRISLRPTVEVHKQRFKGDDWYVLTDPLNNRFYRIRPEAYVFVARLSPRLTVQQVWRDCLERFPERAPGQDEVVKLLAQLHLSELLYFDNAPDSERIFQRGVRRRERELRARLLNILFIRFPLWDPAPMWRMLQPIISLVVSPVGAAIWFAVVVLGVKAVLDRGGAALEPTVELLAPGNLPWLYLALIIVKGVHETGHAALCRYFGGEVHTFGIILAVFTPLPYVDVSSSWRIRSRYARALIGAGGMLAEAFVAALAALVWAHTDDGTIHGLAWSVMITASVSTLVFNINPLLRFDGYYILSDLLDSPNLYARAQHQVRYLIEHYGFGETESSSPAASSSERWWLAVFGVASQLYRVLVYVGIILVVADQLFLVGVVMAVLAVVTMGVVPAVRYLHYLATSPRLARCRVRALAVGLGLLGVPALALAAVPVSRGVHAAGVIEAQPYAPVFAGTAGTIEEVRVASGQRVDEGDVLLVLANEDIAFDLAIAEALMRETKASINRARQDAIADLAPLMRRFEALQQRVDKLVGDRRALTVTARQPGVWVAPDLAGKRGSWVERGSELGSIVSERAARFSAVVTQEAAADLFDGVGATGAVRIVGQADTDLTVHDLEIIPFEQHRLPSATLGWQGGGTIATAADAEGRTSREPFFQVFARLPADAPVALLHGRSGTLRLTLVPEPLLWQAVEGVRQLLQKRYKL